MHNSIVCHFNLLLHILSKISSRGVQI